MGITKRRVGAEIQIYSPGGGINKHQHEGAVHVLYILEGAADYTIGEQTYRAGPGTMLYLPERVPHSMEVVGKKNLILVWFDGPAPEG
jgi:quercetin dioxygenase-like cupin family protein